MKKTNKSIFKVINILSDSKYHDGTSIGAALHMSRTAVWKVIKKLQGNGVKIDSIKGKGYALQEPLILLDEDTIKSGVQRNNVELRVFETVDSTNNCLKTSNQVFNAKGIIENNSLVKLCLAEQQTQGRGRFDRKWYSPFGKNIYLSCLYPFSKDISELGGLSLVVGLAIAKTLNSYCGQNHFFVKWPNDIVNNDAVLKKISGSLIEIQAESHGVCQVVIGIGINVNMINDENEITQSWTSLQKALNQYIDRNELSVRLINQLLSCLEAFDKQGLKPFKEEWQKADILLNKAVTLQHVNEQFTGRVTGINDQGHLLLRFENGSERAFSSGEASVVKKPLPADI